MTLEPETVIVDPNAMSEQGSIAIGRWEAGGGIAFGRPIGRWHSACF
jgi:hypothetical protein